MDNVVRIATFRFVLFFVRKTFLMVVQNSKFIPYTKAAVSW